LTFAVEFNVATAAGCQCRQTLSFIRYPLETAAKSPGADQRAPPVAALILDAAWSIAKTSASTATVLMLLSG
jgi:hypothetical protein